MTGRPEGASFMVQPAWTQNRDPPLPEILRRVVAAIDTDRIILFGSRARGDARPDSDYDLLIIKSTHERTRPWHEGPTER